ncbi:TIGR03618 family F420-dependent PPOX class oxidoreductase [Gryllotalpicola sp.]|uniref:TIGR03618 family F420-dependent PPOX class oxidoreductase n=1 Tax=Gryllotalpicola sp. TaxID=1932787 RepID=UPI00262EB75C|nr:TIGR03618 family F420-dependent PPOX class oxidoreductase [Gryllotalpicola sp.]
MTDAAAIPESHRDLLTTTEAAGFTTIGPDGRPQTSAIWFLLDGDVIRTSIHGSRQRYRNALATPAGSLFVIDPANAYRTIDVRGDLVVEDDPDLAFLTRILARYGRTLESFGPPDGDRHVLTLVPRRVRVTG